MRGKRVLHRVEQRDNRLIPAYAGKTHGTAPRSLKSSAHPRVCGENFYGSLETFFVLGSSPRMRGKPGDHAACTSHAGLIPAYAGKTPSGGVSGGLVPAHPRVCGENAVIFRNGSRILGSSPRMRGKQTPDVTALPVSGLIPAYAGKTSSLLSRPL